MDGEIKQRPKFDVVDDMRQAFVVMKNEIKKFVRGRKIILFGILLLLVISLLTSVFFIFDVESGDLSLSEYICMNFASFAYFMLLLAATLFSSTSIASEYEERTALILFTKPLRKWSIYLGKYMASLVVVGAALLIYYAAMAAVSYAKAGSVPGSILTSLGLGICCLLACTGVAFLASSIMKKSSTASIMTFALLTLVLLVIAGCLVLGNIDTWALLTDAQNDISNCFNSSSNVHVARSAGVMIAWCIIPSIIGYFVFRHRDF